MTHSLFFSKDAPDPTKNLTFNLNLTETQQASRSQVPLPYEHDGTSFLSSIRLRSNGVGQVDHLLGIRGYLARYIMTQTRPMTSTKKIQMKTLTSSHTYQQQSCIYLYITDRHLIFVLKLCMQFKHNITHFRFCDMCKGAFATRSIDTRCMRSV